MPKEKRKTLTDVLDRATKTLWYYETGEQFETFKSEKEGHAWLKKNDPEGVLWEARRGPMIPKGTADRSGVPRAED